MKMRSLLNESTKIKISEKIINDLIDGINKISDDQNLKTIEKMVKISELMGGEYIGKNGNVWIYRSPNNRTLSAAKGSFKKQSFQKIDLSPQKVLSILDNIM